MICSRCNSLFTPSACDSCRAGSNNWAVSGTRSASGKPIVSNDMHLSLSVPDIWYEAALHLAAAPGTRPRSTSPASHSPACRG